MKTLKVTLVILFIMVYAFILSSCSSKQYIFKDEVLSRDKALGNYLLENELQNTIIENTNCVIIKQTLNLKELK